MRTRGEHNVRLDVKKHKVPTLPAVVVAHCEYITPPHGTVCTVEVVIAHRLRAKVYSGSWENAVIEIPLEGLVALV